MNLLPEDNVFKTTPILFTGKIPLHDCNTWKLIPECSIYFIYIIALTPIIILCRYVDFKFEKFNFWDKCFWIEPPFLRFWLSIFHGVPKWREYNSHTPTFWATEYPLLHNIHWLPVLATAMTHRWNMRLTTITPWILKCDPVIFQVDCCNKDVMP